MRTRNEYWWAENLKWAELKKIKRAPKKRGWKDCLVDGLLNEVDQAIDLAL